MPKVRSEVEIQPFWTTTDGEMVRLYSGHTISILNELPSNSVHTVITSPPYWGLRDYGADKTYEIGSEPSPDCGTQGKANCGQCFVCVMVKVFKAVRRVLRNDGCLWLNLGDCYGDGGNLMGMPWRVALALQANGWILRSDIPWVKRNPMPESATNRPCKALEYVFLLVKDRDYFFDMEAIKPEGTGRRQVEFRCGGVYTHDQSYDNDAVITPKSAEEYKDTSGRNFRNADLWYESMSTPWGMCGVGDELVGLDVTTQGYPGAHYATFPEKLIRPLIKASTSEKGCCAKCGRQWVRVMSEATGGTIGNGDWVQKPKRDKSETDKMGMCGQGNMDSTTNPGTNFHTYKPGKTIGWQPSCECNGRFVKRKVKVDRNGDGEVEETQETYVPRIPLEDHPITPAVVLDPFIGSGTTCAVSIMEGRHSVGIDLNDKYLTNNAIVRIRGVLLDRPAYRRLAGFKEDGKSKPGIIC